MPRTALPNPQVLVFEKSTFFKNWKTAYLHTSGDRRLWLCKTKAASKPFKEIRLEEVTAVEIPRKEELPAGDASLREEWLDRVFVFSFHIELLTPNELLIARTPQDRDLWIERLTRLIEKLKLHKRQPSLESELRQHHRSISDVLAQSSEKESTAARRSLRSRRASINVSRGNLPDLLLEATQGVHSDREGSARSDPARRSRRRSKTGELLRMQKKEALRLEAEIKEVRQRVADLRVTKARRDEYEQAVQAAEDEIRTVRESEDAMLREHAEVLQLRAELQALREAHAAQEDAELGEMAILKARIARARMSLSGTLKGFGVEQAVYDYHKADMWGNMVLNDDRRRYYSPSPDFGNAIGYERDKELRRAQYRKTRLKENLSGTTTTTKDAAPAKAAPRLYISTEDAMLLLDSDDGTGGHKNLTVTPTLPTLPEGAWPTSLARDAPGGGEDAMVKIPGNFGREESLRDRWEHTVSSLASTEQTDGPFGVPVCSKAEMMLMKLIKHRAQAVNDVHSEAVSVGSSELRPQELPLSVQSVRAARARQAARQEVDMLRTIARPERDELVVE